MAQEKRLIGFMVPISWMPAIDSARGDQLISEYVRTVLKRSLSGRTGQCVEGLADDRGHYDRLAAGHMRPDRAEKERRRRARAAELANSPKKLRQRPVPPPVVFSVEPTTGLVWASDLDSQAGQILSSGEYEPCSRHRGVRMIERLLELVDVEQYPEERFVNFRERYCEFR